MRAKELQNKGKEIRWIASSSRKDSQKWESDFFRNSAWNCAAASGERQTLGNQGTIERTQQKPSSIEQLPRERPCDSASYGGSLAIKTLSPLFASAVAIAATVAAADSAHHRTSRRRLPSLWKAALHHLGEISTSNLRAPMSNASPQATAQLLAMIEELDKE